MIEIDLAALGNGDKRQLRLMRGAELSREHDFITDQPSAA
jgi:hypothetical protein